MNKKLLLSTAAATLLATGLATGPALADVTVLAFITKTKSVTVFESISFAKRVDIFVAGEFVLEGDAEAEAIKNVTNFGNVVDGFDVTPDDAGIPGAERIDFENVAHALIQGSISGGTGVLGLNQDVGNMVNQGNVVSVAAISDTPHAVIDAQASADEKNYDNTVTDFEGVVPVGTVRPDVLDPGAVALFVARKTATIDNAINDNAGIVDVNQNAGNMNNQDNADAIAIALGGVLALSEADLGQTNTGNLVNEVETVRRGIISGSINNNAGIVKINQATGNMNNQANNVAFAALTVTAAISTPGGL